MTSSFKGFMLPPTDTEENWIKHNPIIPSGVTITVIIANGHPKQKTGNGRQRFTELEYKKSTPDPLTIDEVIHALMPSNTEFGSLAGTIHNPIGGNSAEDPSRTVIPIEQDGYIHLFGEFTTAEEDYYLKVVVLNKNDDPVEYMNRKGGAGYREFEIYDWNNRGPLEILVAAESKVLCYVMNKRTKDVRILGTDELTYGFAHSYFIYLNGTKPVE